MQSVKASASGFRIPFDYHRIPIVFRLRSKIHFSELFHLSKSEKNFLASFSDILRTFIQEIEQCQKLWYNAFVVKPNPATERGCVFSVRLIYHFRIGKCSCLLHMQMVRRKGWQQLASDAQPQNEKKPRQLELPGFRLCIFNMLDSFAYWYYSICKSWLQYSHLKFFTSQ